MEEATIKSTERVYLWDNLKVILMMLVVMTHSVNVYQLEGYDWIQYLWVFTMTYTMPLFMIISGFWYKPRKMSYSLKHFLYPCVLFSVINVSGGVECGAYPNGVILTKSGWAMWYIWALFIYNLITPVLKNVLGLKKLMLLSISITIIIGFLSISNNFFDVQRVINFYPYFLVGICLRRKEESVYLLNRKYKNVWITGFISIMLLYCGICYFKNGFCYGTGFMQYHGMSLIGFICKWSNFILCLLLSVLVIMAMPNRKIWFSQYGSRTMNVYMLHMSIIFPFCWLLMRPIMNEWYGYILYSCGVPMLCVLLFCKKIDYFMRPVLSLPDRIFRNAKI